VSDLIKLFSPASPEFWEVPILFEDEHLLALSKPARLAVSPDRYDPMRPSLMNLLHRDIERNAGWAKARGLSYLMNAHRLDPETSGVLLLARNKPALVRLANLFGSERPQKMYLALVQGAPAKDSMLVESKLAPHPLKSGLMQVDSRNGKRAKTEVEVLERFVGYTLLRCRLWTDRTDQIRVHLRSIKLPMVGDGRYGGRALLLSRLKAGYRLKPNQTERPLVSRTALHAEQLSLPHPITGTEVIIRAEWPKDLQVAVKYLRRYANTTRNLIPPEALQSEASSERGV
jgi:RluA family pseudouridine synthase